MRILTLIHEYPPIGGGGGRVAQDLARALVKRGHEVRVIAPHHRSLEVDDPTDGVKVIRISSFRSKQFAADLLAMGGYLIVGLLTGLWQILTWKPQLIHVHFAVPAGVLTWILSKLTGVPYVLTAHLGDVPGGVPEKTDSWFRWVYPFTPRIWRDAAQVTAISEHTRRLALAHYPVEIEVIPNGIELSADFSETLTAVHHPPQIVFAGRFVPQKNPIQLVNILARVADLPWQAVMIGDGVLMDETRREIERLGLHERVTLTGWILPEQVHVYFAQSDILLMPSLSEGIPMVGLQALLSGHAIVASRVGGLIDLVEQGGNGFLHEPADLDGFVFSLRSLLSDESALLRARNASLKIAHRFDLVRIVDRYESIFTKVIGECQKQ
ncbi:MAG: glycosyltransferase family 4 protein [Chloroflexi bacterium]|nr:glycosyltransferase family 4 protein [Chloroflexota bacterium]